MPEEYSSLCAVRSRFERLLRRVFYLSCNLSVPV
jgi:hypothetical protein